MHGQMFANYVLKLEQVSLYIDRNPASMNSSTFLSERS
jgi:hypothetical protein